MEKGPNIFLAWLSAHRLTAAAGLFCALLGVLIFWLYGLPGEAIVYLIGLCLVGIAFFGALSFLRFWRKHKTLCTMEEGILMAASPFQTPPPPLRRTTSGWSSGFSGKTGSFTPR